MSFFRLNVWKCSCVSVCVGCTLLPHSPLVGHLWHDALGDCLLVQCFPTFSVVLLLDMLVVGMVSIKPVTHCHVSWLADTPSMLDCCCVMLTVFGSLSIFDVHFYPVVGLFCIVRDVCHLHCKARL